jgi:hypothetical protein
MNRFMQLAQILKQRSCSRSDLPSAAINEQFDACDETGVIRRQKQRHLCYFIGLPIRPIGMVDAVRATMSADWRLTNGVLIGPGLTMFERI